MEDIDILKLVGEMDFSSNKLVNIGNGLMLTNREIEVLDRWKINYKNCSSLKEIIYLIEDVIEDDDSEELDSISMSISERDYYQNTNK